MHRQTTRLSISDGSRNAMVNGMSSPVSHRQGFGSAERGHGPIAEYHIPQCRLEGEDGAGGASPASVSVLRQLAPLSGRRDFAQEDRRPASITMRLMSSTDDVRSFLGEIPTAWGAVMASRRTRALAWCAGPVLVMLLLMFRTFLDVIEARPGVALHDPVLALFAPRDVAFPVFLVLYGALVGLLVALMRYPKQLIIGVWAYIFMVATRMGVMYLLPLDPPRSMIALRDPFVELFGGHHTLTRDLFFSGHTATLFLLALVVPTRQQRAVALMATVVIAGGVLLQHAHYAVDVAAAPFFSYGSYRAAHAMVTRDA